MRLGAEVKSGWYSVHKRSGERAFYQRKMRKQQSICENVGETKALDHRITFLGKPP